MNKRNQNNYINRHDKLLGDLDRIRLKMDNETQEMSVEEELAYYQHKLQKVLILRDKGKIKYKG